MLAGEAQEAVRRDVGDDQPGRHALAAGVAFAECMREVVEECNPGGLPVTASFGVSVGIGDDIEFRPLYRAADEELYRSKDAGRNRVSAGGTTFAAASKTVALG